MTNSSNSGQTVTKFTLLWELNAALPVGGVVAYITGKVWNDVLAGYGGVFAQYKKESTLSFSLISTCVCILLAVLQSTGKTEQWLGSLTSWFKTPRSRAGSGSHEQGLEMSPARSLSTEPLQLENPMHRHDAQHDGHHCN